MVVNTFAQIVAAWMASEFERVPRFRRSKRADGEFEATLKAPRRSQARQIIVFTDKGNAWVRFAPPHLAYPVESRAELRRVLRALLSDRALFVVIYRREKWESVTLIRRGQLPALGNGQVAHIVSWSGRFDRVIMPRARRQTTATRHPPRNMV